VASQSQCRGSKVTSRGSRPVWAGRAGAILLGRKAGSTSVTRPVSRSKIRQSGSGWRRINLGKEPEAICSKPEKAE
jgi:hypothetical protein